MPTYRIVLAYDGTGFEGWQAQASTRAARTVQGVLEDALAPLAGGSRVAVAGAGRTDAGVHAEGQVASLRLPRPLAPQRLRAALNARLPPDVRVLEATEADEAFHARRWATGKLYRYEVDLAPVQLPTRRRLAAHHPAPLDPAPVHAAAALFVGRHDFAALAATGSSVATSVRTVARSEVVRLDAERLVYETEGEGYLRRMVRNMVGAVLAAGRGDVTPTELAARLASRAREGWPAPAPAHGLTLVRVSHAALPPPPGTP